MEAVSLPETHEKHLTFDYIGEEVIFEKLFKLLNRTLGLKSFGAKYPSSETIAEAFRVYHYESITMGLLGVIDKIDENNVNHIQKLKTALEEIKRDSEFIKLTTGGGKNTKNLLNKRIQFVSEKLKSIEW